MLPLYSVSRYSFSGSLESKAKPIPFKLPKQLTTDFCCVLILSSYQLHRLNTGAFTLLTLHPGRLRAPHLLLLQCLILTSPSRRAFSILLPNFIILLPTFLCLVFSLSHPHLIYTYFYKLKIQFHLKLSYWFRLQLSKLLFYFLFLSQEIKFHDDYLYGCSFSTQTAKRRRQNLNCTLYV